MDNIAVYLSQQEWQQVIGMISFAPWRDANPILMKIGEQLRTQQPSQVMQNPGSIKMPGNGPNKEAVR